MPVHRKCDRAEFLSDGFRCPRFLVKPVVARHRKATDEVLKPFSIFSQVVEQPSHSGGARQLIPTWQSVVRAPTCAGGDILEMIPEELPVGEIGLCSRVGEVR